MKTRTSSNGMGVKFDALVICLVLGLGVMPIGARAATILAEMTEDFSHSDWSTTTAGTSSIDTGDNGWAIRNDDVWQYDGANGNAAPSILWPGNGDTASGHYAAKPHSLGTDGRTSFRYRLAADIQLDTRGSMAQVLLGNNVGSNYGAGYMIRYVIRTDGGVRNLSVFENTGGTNQLPGGPTPNFGSNALGNTDFTTVALGGAEAFYTLNMELKQSGPGQPFTITAWVDGFGSEDAPLLTFTDSHDNGLNLADLAYVAFTTQNGITGGNNVRLDNITVQLIPEPASAVLLLLGAAALLNRRRRG